MAYCTYIIFSAQKKKNMTHYGEREM